jgi:hypothetical protein
MRGALTGSEGPRRSNAPGLPGLALNVTAHNMARWTCRIGGLDAPDDSTVAGPAAAPPPNRKSLIAADTLRLHHLCHPRAAPTFARKFNLHLTGLGQTPSVKCWPTCARSPWAAELHGTRRHLRGSSRSSGPGRPAMTTLKHLHPRSAPRQRHAVLVHRRRRLLRTPLRGKRRPDPRH